MQSDLDPDYLEYQMLSARWAHIDGFMVEWGAPDHAGNAVLVALEQAARKYGLKVGVNWCIGWAKQGLPPGAGRDVYLRRLDAAADYLMTTLYAAPNAATFNGRPVIMIFGGDLTDDEFHRLAGRFPPGPAAPILLRQGMIGGSETEGRMVMTAADSDWFTQAKGFAPDVGGVFAWVPARLRPTTGPDAKWDRYATVGDTTDYLAAWLALPAPRQPFFRMISATPGFDNRPAAGWTSNDLSHIARDQLQVYDAMWRFDIARRARFDWLLIPTWNDWTEGSEIEPSVEDQGAALAMTERRAAELKGIIAQPEGVALPLRLFKLRQGWGRVARITGVPANPAALDTIAHAIDDGAIDDGALDRAFGMLSEAERALAAAEAALPRPQHMILKVGENGLSIVKSDAQTLGLALPAPVAARLNSGYFDAVLGFGYRTAADGTITVKTATTRPASPQGDFGIVAQIKTKASADWQSARVRLYAQNTSFRHSGNADLTFVFSTPVAVRDVTIDIDLYPARDPAKNPAKNPAKDPARAR